MNWGGIAGGVAGAMRGFEGAQGRGGPAPAQNGMLMNYIRQRQAKKATPAGIPDGQIPMPLPSTQTAGPAPVVPPNPNAAESVPTNNFAQPETAQVEDYNPNPNKPRYPQAMAQGRVVDKPTTAILGEDGPEMVVPLNGRPDARVSTANLPQMKYNRGC